MIKNCIIIVLLSILIGGANWVQNSKWLYLGDPENTVINKDEVEWIYDTKNTVYNEEKKEQEMKECVNMSFKSGNTLKIFGIKSKDFKDILK